MVASGGGTVVNISSQAGATGTGSSIAYAAAKGAVNTMTLSLARVLAPEIRVNCVAPGLTDTRWNRDGLGDEVYETVLARYRENVPLRRAAEADEVADAVVWLVAGAALVTGQILTVDSGMHLGFAPLLAR
jgi:3-oxoacyl-[acyl-carrier protein] reductase